MRGQCVKHGVEQIAGRFTSGLTVVVNLVEPVFFQQQPLGASVLRPCTGTHVGDGRVLADFDAAIFQAVAVHAQSIEDHLLGAWAEQLRVIKALKRLGNLGLPVQFPGEVLQAQGQVLFGVEGGQLIWPRVAEYVVH